MTIERAYAAASDTLDQTSYTQVDSMTLTPPSGDYLATFSMQMQFNTTPTNNILRIAIYVGGTIVDHSERQYQGTSSLNDMYFGLTTSAYISPNGSQVVEVRYYITTGASFDATKRELNLFPALNTNYQDTDTVDDTIASGTWATLDTMTRTPANGDYLLVFTASATMSAVGDTVNFRLSVGGTPVAHTERLMFMESSADPSIYNVMLTASISPNGSQVVEIEWARSTGTGTQTCFERNMILIEMPSADIKQAQGTATDTDSSSGSDVAIDDMLLTDPGDNDWLVLFSSSDYYPSVGAPFGVTTYKIYEGGAEDTNLTRIFEHEDSLDNTTMSLYLSGRVTLGLSTDDIQAYWNGNSTLLREIYERTLNAIREPSITYKLDGITKDKDGVALGSCLCFLVKDNGDNTFTWLDYQLSNGSGVYSFTGISDNDAAYQVIAWKDDTPHVFDVTDHVLQPVAE